MNYKWRAPVTVGTVAVTQVVPTADSVTLPTSASAHPGRNRGANLPAADGAVRCGVTRPGAGADNVVAAVLAVPASLRRRGWMPFKGRAPRGPLPASPGALFRDLSTVLPAQVIDRLTLRPVAAV